MQCSENFKKNYNGDSDEGHFLEVDVQYPENVHNLHNHLPFWAQRMNIEKVEELIVYRDKKLLITHIRNLKEALNHKLVLKKVHIH